MTDKDEKYNQSETIAPPEGNLDKTDTLLNKAPASTIKLADEVSVLSTPFVALHLLELCEPMTSDEARQCIEKIKGHCTQIRRLLVDLEERRGWFALGYSSMRQCILSEFDLSKSHLYRELTAGKIEKNLSPMGDIGKIPERQLRELTKLPETEWLPAWEEAVKTAPPLGLTATHVKNTVAKFQLKQADTLKEDEFNLGDWVEVKHGRENSTFVGQKGAVVIIDLHEIGVKLDIEKPKIIRFYRDDLIKIPAPNDDLDKQLNDDFQPGDVVWINCGKDAEKEQRALNGTWGIVEEVRLTLTVKVKGKMMNFLKRDVELIENDSETLRAIGEKINQLYQNDDLDDLARHLLDFLVTRKEFTEFQLDLLDSIWQKYN